MDVWNFDTDPLAEIMHNYEPPLVAPDEPGSKTRMAKIAVCLIKNNVYTNGDVAFISKKVFPNNEIWYEINARGYGYDYIWGCDGSNNLEKVKKWLKKAIHCWVLLPNDFQSIKKLNKAQNQEN